MTSKAEQLVKKLKTKEDKTKEYKHASEWPKCCAAGCPLPTTIKADKPTCTYHHREHGRSADCITEAIKENLFLLRKYRELIYWSVRDWQNKKAEIMGWPVLPATADEIDRPTVYLNKFKKFIDDRIKERAEEIYKGN